MAKIIYRITPVEGFRSPWYTSRRGQEISLTQYWFSLVEKAKRLGVFTRQGICKDGGLYFHCRYASGEQRTFKFVK